MENERGMAQQQQPGANSGNKFENTTKEQFNELSELSLEARMAVADQIGVPVNNLGDAAALGTMQNRDDITENAPNNSEDDNNRKEGDVYKNE